MARSPLAPPFSIVELYELLHVVHSHAGREAVRAAARVVRVHAEQYLARLGNEVF